MFNPLAIDRKKRFIVILSTLLALAFLATSLVSYFAARDSLRRQIEESTLPLTSDNIYSEIQQDLLRPIFISSLMAQDTFVRDWTLAGEVEPERMVRYLKSIEERYGTVTSFFVSERTRLYYHASRLRERPVDEANPRDAWYFRVRQMKSDYEINVDFDEVNRDKVTIFINYKVYDYSGRYIGATGVGLAVDAVTKLIDDYSRRYGRQIYFADRQGRVTVHGPAYAGPDDIRHDSALAPLAIRILANPSGSFTYERDGRTVYLNSRLVPEFQWVLLVEQEDTATQSQIFRALVGNLVICIGITLVVLFLANLTIGGYQRRLEEMATTDKLTGMANRQVFDVLFTQVEKTTRRRGGSISAMLLDIDRFKAVNDTYGHPAGDAVIQAVAILAKNEIRESDSVFRWGGEEFVILLADCDLNQGVQLAERIRGKIEARSIVCGRDHVTVTVSIGVAELQASESAYTLIGRADAALLGAKQNGRNQVRTSPPAGTEILAQASADLAIPAASSSATSLAE